jgi:hypothetical protein
MAKAFSEGYSFDVKSLTSNAVDEIEKPLILTIDGFIESIQKFIIY